MARLFSLEVYWEYHDEIVFLTASSVLTRSRPHDEGSRLADLPA
jgi:hypothetical protein